MRDKTWETEVRDILGACALFRNLAPDIRNSLVARARIRKYAAGQTIFLTGDAHDSLMAVISGRVRISAPSPDGKEILLTILESGEVFGEIALLDGKVRSADARAMTDCQLAVLERRDVLHFVELDPQVWRGFVEVLCARLRQTDDHLVEVALLDLPVRLAKALLRSGQSDGPGAGVVRMSQRELGNFVGASRERVNRCLQQWQRAGIVRVEKGTVSIIKPAALEAIGEPG